MLNLHEAAAWTPTEILFEALQEFRYEQSPPDLPGTNGEGPEEKGGPDFSCRRMLLQLWV